MAKTLDTSGWPIDFDVNEEAVHRENTIAEVDSHHTLRRIGSTAEDLSPAKIGEKMINQASIELTGPLMKKADLPEKFK